MRMLTGIVALALTSGSAVAQDLLVYGGAELELLHEEDGPGTGTNSYLSGYVELEASGFYAGLWAQVADDDLMDEVDLYLGYRNETAAGLSYDLGYTRYTYPNDDASNYGEVTVSLGVPVGDLITTTVDLAYDPEAELGNAYIELAYAATDTLELSANYGVYEVDAAPSEREWDLGATYAFGEMTAVDFRYYDGSEYVDSYFGLSLTWDSTLLGG